MPFVSVAPPPLPVLEGMHDAGELCQRGDVRGMGLGFDPSILAAGIIAPIAGIFKAKEETKAAKATAKVEAQAVKAATQQAAREFAMEQAKAITEPLEAQRRDQMIGLIAIGAVALLISGTFLISTMRMKR